MANLTEKELDDFNQRIIHVKNWLDKYGPKFVKFQVMKKIPRLKLSDEQTAFLGDLANLLEEKEFNSAEVLHDEMYEILNSHGLKPQKAFQTLYKMILGQKQGPKALSFILSLDKEFVVKRLRMEE